MATFVLIHGAASDGWYWHLVEPELRAAGHDVVAVDLPCDDDEAGFEEYADAVVAAIGGRHDVVLVAQSLGGFTAPLVCERVPVDLMVLVAAMVPAPGELPGDWWDHTGQSRAFAEQVTRDGRDPSTAGEDVGYLYFHDVPADVTEAAMAHGERDQSGTPLTRPYPMARWPDVATRFLLCRDDRLFPASFQRRVVRERLGIVPDEMDGGHLPALARPGELAEWLLSYRADWERTAAG